jgi:hypothetical protein
MGMMSSSTTTMMTASSSAAKSSSSSTTTTSPPPASTSRIHSCVCVLVGLCDHRTHKRKSTRKRCCCERGRFDDSFD